MNGKSTDTGSAGNNAADAEFAEGMAVFRCRKGKVDAEG